MNNANLMGRLTKDPELKYGASGTAYANFTIAVNRAFKKDEVDFINCACFGKTAEAIAEYARKGDQVGVNGRIQVDQYEKDGTKVYSTKVMVDGFTFGAKANGGGNSSEGNTSSKPTNTPKPNNTPEPDFDDDDEFPF